MCRVGWMAVMAGAGTAWDRLFSIFNALAGATVRCHPRSLGLIALALVLCLSLVLGLFLGRDPLQALQGLLQGLLQGTNVLIGLVAGPSCCSSKPAMFRQPGARRCDAGPLPSSFSFADQQGPQRPETSRHRPGPPDGTHARQELQARQHM